MSFWLTAQKRHRIIMQQVPHGGFKKSMCPATMGGRCQWVVNDNGQERCKRCERIKEDDNVQQALQSYSQQFVEQIPEGGIKKWMCSRTMGGQCSFKTNDSGQEQCKLCKKI